jgi:hypothetical protein
MTSTVIIGTGISAAAYLLSVSRNLGMVHGTGGPDLWHQMSPDHAMGQPTQLLTGNLLGSGRTMRGFNQTPRAGTTPFMKARDFAALVEDHLARKAHFQLPGSLVDKIKYVDGKYQVFITVWNGSVMIVCDNVIIAMGAGPPRPLMVGEDGKLEVNVPAHGGYIVGGTEFMSPNWTMPNGHSGRGAVVAVYGGSATAAWAVELARLRHMQLGVWFTRPGDGASPWDTEARFKAAFPAGERNTRVKEETRDLRAVLKLIDIKMLPSSDGLPFVGLTFTNQAGQTIRLAVDVLVYALGAEHTKDTGIRAMLDAPLQKDLVAYYDRNLAISAKPSILAVGSADGTLMIVGSAMCSLAGFGLSDLEVQGEKPTRKMESLAKYTDISESLPPAARPPEGIGMVMAGIEALNQYIPATPVWTSGKGFKRRTEPGYSFHPTQYKWDINFNVSNRTQLAVYFAQETDLSPFAANLAVALIVRLRTRPGNPLGLSDQQINFIVGIAEWFAAETERLNVGLWQTRLEWDQSETGAKGGDRFLTMCIDHMTTGDWAAYWQRHDIRCS